MRFVLDPGGDVEVPDGLTLADCRPALVRLTGDPGLADAPVRVTGRELAEDHPAGTVPWVDGSVLTSGEDAASARLDAAAHAAHAPWHLAVVGGPRAGLVVGAADGRATVEPDPAAPEPAGPRARRRERLEVRQVTRRRPHTGERWWARVVREDAAAPGRWYRLREGAATSGRWRRVHPGEPIRVGRSRVVVRRGTEPDGPTVGSAPVGRAPGGPTPVDRAPVAAWLVPLAVSAGLALATRNPVYLLFALSGPLAQVLTRRRPVRGRVRHAPEQLALDPAAAMVLLHRGGTAGARTATDTGRAGPGTGSGPRTGSAPEPNATTPPSPDAPWWSMARDGLAVTGPREAVLGTARALVGDALVRGPLGLTLLHSPDDDAEWSWCRWLTAQLGTGPGRRLARAPADADAVLNLPPGNHPDGRHLVVVDDPRGWPTLAGWWGRHPRVGSGAVVLIAPGQTPPAWCRWVLRVTPHGPATLESAGSRRDVSAPWAPFAWAERVARTCAGAAATSWATAPTKEAAGSGAIPRTTTELPDRVGLADLLDRVPDRTLGRGGLRALATPVGVGHGADGTPGPLRHAPVVVDLIGDGPHALVAGTTGAGKSEALQSLVLGLALRHPPTVLAVVLVDYKGGAGFGACRDLPHVVGQVTDLDQVESARALDGLRAELRRREHLLARAGVSDLETLRDREDAPPRLLVVVDEFRALTQDLPDFVPGLVRLAAQGRSLGIHLVLATQRPAGAVSAEMRANIALRLCLRVTEPADSSDVVEVPDAAWLPTSLPGRAVLRRGPAAPELVQTAWAALPPGTWPERSPGLDRVRWAPPWPQEATPVTRTPPTTDHSVALVETARRRAEEARTPPPAAIWLPPLPERVHAADLAGLAGVGQPGPPGGEVVEDGLLPFALADLPAQQRRTVACWHARTGPLVIAGRSGSGRTTTLLTLGLAALRRGWQVHAACGPGALTALGGDPRTGTVVGPDDPRRMARLLHRLATPGPGGDRLLLVDDWDTVRVALDRMPRGAAADLLEPLLRDGRRHGLAVAVAGSPVEIARLVPVAAERLVLPVADPHQDALLGVPREHAGARTAAGRSVHLTADGAHRCQVVLDDPSVVVLGRTRAHPPRPAHAPHRAGPEPIRVAPIPWHVGPRDLVAGRQAAPGPAVTDAGAPVIGIGGDDAAPVRLDTALGALVVGPAGSGRTTTLDTLVAGLVAGGRTVLVVGEQRAALPHVDTCPVTDLPARLRDLAPATASATSAAMSPPVVVLDDADLRLRARPDVDEALAALVAAAEGGDRCAPRVVAAARTDRAASAYRGLVAALRAAAPVLVLSPAAAGSSDVAGTDLALCVDPNRPHHPGRGALVHRGRATCLQVATVRAEGVATASSRARRAG